MAVARQPVMRRVPRRAGMTHSYRPYIAVAALSLIALVSPLFLQYSGALSHSRASEVPREIVQARKLAYRGQLRDTRPHASMRPVAAPVTVPMPGTEAPRAASGGEPVPILMYHHIRDFSDPNNPVDTNLSTPVQGFRDQMQWLKENGYTTITFSELFSGTLPEKPIVLTFDDGYQDNYTNAFKILKENGQKGVFFLISSTEGGGYLTQSEIREMAGNGMEIESHTISHPDLSQLGDEALAKELGESRNTIEEGTGQKVEFLCYPSGRFSKDVIDAAKTAGYRAAVTTKSSSSNGSLYELPRIRMNPEDGPRSLKSKLAAYQSSNDGFTWRYR